jgi:hypothetical protein
VRRRRELNGSGTIAISAAAWLMVVVAFSSPLGRLQAAEGPIGEVTRGLPDVSLPKNSTDNLPARYGLGYPVQVGPTTAALFCNLRLIGPRRTDYEDGTDAFIFDDLRCVGIGGPTPISRNEKEKDAETGEPRFIVKYPAAVGFWPLGAKQPDGSAHPGAGKGFALCHALSLVGRGDELVWEMFSKPYVRSYVEVMQLSFDGRQVSVGKRDLIRTQRMWAVPDGWGVACNGLQTAIPDGSDLLMAVVATKDGINRTGVCRFRFRGGQWQPVTFTPVADGSEPSLARRADRSLVFLMRPDAETGYGANKSIRLWASTDGGGTWKQILHAANVRPQTPVSVHATPDGTVFVLANVPGMTNPTRTVMWWHLDRTRLAMWQLAEDATEFKPPQAQLIRDCQEEFGLIDKSMWYVDHPVSATVRLRDGRWHGVVAYRMMAFSIYGDKVGELVTPQTGCCVEEVPSAQPITPPWRF